MVPSLRVLPRWGVVASALAAAAGVALGLGLVGWLAVVVSRGGRPDTAVAAPRTPRPPPCPEDFPERGCPALQQSLLALRCQTANRAVFDRYVADLFPLRTDNQRRRLPESQDEANDAEEDDDDNNGDQRQGRPVRDRRPGLRSRRDPDSTTTMVCYLLVTLLAASGVLAIGEVLRDWWTGVALKAQQQGHAAALYDVAERSEPGALVRPSASSCRKQLSRRCSLVDLTVSRHERRQSQVAALHAHAQHSLPGVLVGARPPPLYRRSSFPAAPCVGRAPAAAGTAVSSPPCGGGRRRGERGVSLEAVSPRRRPSFSSPSLSFDLSDGDSSPDTGRKRVRIIRRH